MGKQLLTLLMLLWGSLALAQQRTVSGKVTDQSGNPLPNVNILVKGTAHGTATDFEGLYTLNNVNLGDIIEYSYIGFVTQTRKISDNRQKITLNVVLIEDTQELEDVVVVGYGTQKKTDVTGAVASVDYKQLATQPINTVNDALKGRIAGVHVFSNSGAPGGSISVRVRGVGTVNNADPLYVVDGVPTSDINFLNPNDIASIEVLKDASSSAIYGSRGANGVVLVTTKGGKFNMPSKINIDTYAGVKNLINNWQLTNGAEWYDIQKALNETRTKPINLSLVSRDVSTDWLKEISRTAFVSDGNVSFSGGTDKLVYMVAGGFYKEEGTIIGTDYQRITARLKSDYKVKDYLKVGVNINIQSSDAHNSILEGNPTVGTINTAIKLEPNFPVWIDQSKGKYDYSKFTDFPNPVAQIAYNNDRSEKLRMLANVYAEFELLKDLKFKSSYGWNRTSTDNYSFTPVYEVNVNQRNLENSIYRYNGRNVYQTWENTFNYTKEIGKHNISALYGFTKEKSRYEWVSGSKNNIPNEDKALWFLDAATSGDAAKGSASEFTLMSYLGRINYSFDNKYLITASYRADGSSRFSKGNRWGYFPSVALGWRISEENFLKNTEWLSSLKLRAGWGQIGNQSIGTYPYQTTINGNAQYRYLFGEQEDIWQGYVVTAMRDKNIKWETVESVNVGFDASFFNGKLDLTFDWFNKDTKDMLLSVPIPLYYGYENGPVVNVGKANNKGIELSLNWKNKVSNDFDYNIGFNISTYQNKMTSIGNGNPITGGDYKNGSATRTEEGESIGFFYGYKTAGLFQSQAEIDNWAIQQGKDNSALQPGDLKFVDVTGDGTVDDKDRTKIGSPDPDFIYGVNLGVNYKGWELNAFVQGSQGNEIFNAMKTHLYQFDETNKHKDMVHSWTPTNTDTQMPRLTAKDKNNTNRASDRFVEDGSYVRLKNVTLAYNLPSHWMEKVKMSQMKLYVSAQNLLTFTKYSGADPEIGQVSSSNYLSRGVDLGIYPQARTFVMGLKMQF
ncbi:SusC/RagA family TonB-linked outer membrane protein [Capnocytophaga canimorsus]|uniref:SusC/RagA family TonB-linked outer membrane protein n=1 Tax=Capnocytophaga canimorsus TaxID=28188 RepID=UPI00385D2C05